MPWKSSSVMEERIKFVIRAGIDGINFSALCRSFGISRPTGYRWLKRYRDSGSISRLGELSRRPHHSPNRTPDVFEQRVMALRRKHGWGARKLRILLLDEGLDLKVTTINRILKRNGLVEAEE